MNTQKYIDFCQGNYGRKIAYTGVSEITSDNVVKVLGKAIGVHNFNRPFIKYLYQYYKGDQPINYKRKTFRPEINNKICENHALEVVRFKASQTYGEPIQYVSKKKDDLVNKGVDILNDYMDDAHAQARNIELGVYQSAIGTAYKAITKEEDWTKDNGKVPFGIFIPDPMNTFIIYSLVTGKEMMSVQCLKDEEENNYYLCYTRKNFFKIRNGKVIDSGINGFDEIPVKEYPNNADRLSDIEICITIFDSINNMQSSRMDSVDQFVQTLLLFKNCEVDEDAIRALNEIGALQIKDTSNSTKSEIKFLTAELNQEQSQVAKEDLYRNMLIVEGMPDRQQNTGGDTGQAVYLRNGWDFAESRAKLDEPFIIEAEKKIAQVVLNIIKKTSQDVNITVRDFDVKITRNSTDNMLVKAQALDYLIKNKIHPLIAITTCGLFGDPEKVWTMSQPYMERLYQDVDVESQKQKAEDLLNNMAIDNNKKTEVSEE